MSSTIISTTSNDEFYADEVNGEIVETKAVFFVKMTGLSGFQQALDATGVPRPGDPYNNDNPFCKVVRRVISYYPRKNSGPLAKIEVYYELQRPDNVNISPLAKVVSGTTNLSQETTNLDINGTVITTEYNGVQQGGEVSVFLPRQSIVFETTEVTATPDDVADEYVGKLNSATWRNGDPGTWMCVDAPYDLVDGKSSPPRYAFRWAFEYNKDGHDPDVVYIDPTTNKPPADLVDGTGYKTVTYYERVNFATKFPT